MYAEYWTDLPTVAASWFPEEERKAVQRADNALQSFASHLTNFRYALQLFDTCLANMNSIRAHRDSAIKEARETEASAESKIRRDARERMDPFRAWLHIAARDGAMQLFHVGKALSAVVSAISRAPTLASYVDHKERRVAEKLFASYFPGHEGVRHTVGHAAEFFDNLGEHAVKGLKIPGFINADKNSTVMILDEIRGRTVSATYEGTVVSYEISVETLQKLESVLKHLFNAFEPLETANWPVPGEKLKPREPSVPPEKD